MKAKTALPVHQLIAERWSPYVFDERPIENLDLLFEAARWAPSSYNEQPWSFVLGFKGSEGYERIFSLLVEFNQQWTQHAPVLGISVARTYFEKNHKPNRHAYHDVGLAMGMLILQAVELGLAVHQMAGFRHEEANKLLKLPEGHEAVAAFAIGYAGDPTKADPELAGKDEQRRPRREQSSFLFEGEWGQAL